MKLFDSNMFGLSFDKNSGAGTADGQTNTTVRNVVVRNVHFDFSGARRPRQGLLLRICLQHL